MAISWRPRIFLVAVAIVLIASCIRLYWRPLSRVTRKDIQLASPILKELLDSVPGWQEEATTSQSDSILDHGVPIKKSIEPPARPSVEVGGVVPNGVSKEESIESPARPSVEVGGVIPNPSSHLLDDASCQAINEHEMRADAALYRYGFANLSLAEYQVALAAWRESFVKAGKLQPACRVAHLGNQLCNASIRFEGHIKPKDKMTRELSETVKTKCGEFHNYKKLGLKPHFWESEAVNDAVIQDIVKDPDYVSSYARGAHLAPPYGPSPFDTVNVGDGSIARGRAYHLEHMRRLRRAIPGFEWADLHQVVVVGAALGEFSAMLWDLGFFGNHIAMDTLPALLGMRFFLRLAGIPAFLGMDVKTQKRPDPVLAQGKIILDTLEGDTKQYMDKKKYANSLFFSTNTLSELGGKSRAKLWDHIIEFGFVYLTWRSSLDEHEKQVWNSFLEKAGEYWETTHNVQIWHYPPGHPETFYLVAVKRTLGFWINCSVDIGCSPESFVTYY